MVNKKMANIKAELKFWAVIIGLLIFGVVQGLIARWLGYDGP